MKTIFSGFIALVLLLSTAKAQPNNPYQDRGRAWLESVKFLQNEIQEGRMKDFSEKTIQAYSAQIPIKNSMNQDLAFSIYKTLKDPETKLEEFILASNRSAICKDLTLSLLLEKLSPGQSLQDYLSKQVDLIQSTKMDAGEKELLLTLAAIRNVSGELTNPTSRGGCELQVSTHNVELGLGACVTALATVGAYVGFSVCGVLCGVGGAVVGAVVGVVASIS